MNSPVHSLADTSLRDNSRIPKNVAEEEEEEEERRKRIFDNVSGRTSYSYPCNDAEQHFASVPKTVPEDKDALLNRIIGNVSRRKRTTEYKNVPTTRKLKEELTATCVGYCGADLKALCTGGYEFEKSHFVEAMSAITPAAHRGSVVQSRPLSPVVWPCLQRHLFESMRLISDIFPSSATSSELTKLSVLSFGSAIPHVYRPRLLLLGGEGVGLDHLGPAILHKLEKFPIHSLGLPSLLSDPGEKTPEEALVHIFSEARRTTPSILYVPMFNNWWRNEHEQLRVVFMKLLEELPSNLPILLLATSYGELSDMEEQSVFDNRSVYTMEKPSREDRSLFFDRLIEAALSVISGLNGKFDGPNPLSELPKFPKAPTGPKPAEIKAKVEADQHALGQ